ncbi:metallopeptidase, partial [Staphylococcus felis]
MYNIKIIRSDKVYLDLLEQEYDNKSQYFKDNLLTY